MSDVNRVLREIRWLNAKATMRTIKPRSVVNKVSFLQTKLAVDEIETFIKEEDDD